MIKRLLVLTLFFSAIFMQTAHAKDIMLKEKIGQMLIFGFKGMEVSKEDPIVKAILAKQVGGVILFDYDVKTKTYVHNIKNPAQVKKLNEQLQYFNNEAFKNTTALPLLIGVDYEGGKVNRLKDKYGFPATLSAAEIGQTSLEKARAYAITMANTLKENGFNFNFAPVLDVNVNPDNPVIGKVDRSFSNDPKKVTQFALIFSEAYKKAKIACSYKHFPGHGSSTGDTHAGFVDVTQTWQEYELNPYKDLLANENSCGAVMTAHVVHYGLDSKGYPASISNEITSKLLREKLGFKGVVVTDDLQMKAISDNYGLHDAVRLAINAGADLLVFGNQLVDKQQDPQQIVDMIYNDVKTGKIPVSRIDDAYQRIVNLKKQL